MNACNLFRSDSCYETKKENNMKPNTILPLIFSFTLLLTSTAGLFANSDGYLIRNSSPVVSTEINPLSPQVPELAEFTDSGDLFSFNEPSLFRDQLVPSIPAEATFEDQVQDNQKLNPVVPKEAPYQELF